MELKNQVVSLEIAEKLDGLMPRKPSLFAYYGNAGTWHEEAIVDMSMYAESDEDFKKHKLLPAYTVAELGEILPFYIQGVGELVCVKNYLHRDGLNTSGWNVGYNKTINGGTETPRICADTEANARGLMLIYLLENKLI